MRRLDSCVDDAVAEKAAPLMRFDRLGCDVEPALDHALSRPVLRQTAKVAARIGDGRAEGADRDVAKIVQQRALRAAGRYDAKRLSSTSRSGKRSPAMSDRLSCNFAEHAWVLPIEHCTKKCGSDSQL